LHLVDFSLSSPYVHDARSQERKPCGKITKSGGDESCERVVD